MSDKLIHGLVISLTVHCDFSSSVVVAQNVVLMIQKVAKKVLFRYVVRPTCKP